MVWREGQHPEEPTTCQPRRLDLLFFPIGRNPVNSAATSSDPLSIHSFIDWLLIVAHFLSLKCCPTPHIVNRQSVRVPPFRYQGVSHGSNLMYTCCQLYLIRLVCVVQWCQLYVIRLVCVVQSGWIQCTWTDVRSLKKMHTCLVGSHWLDSPCLENKKKGYIIIERK